MKNITYHIILLGCLFAGPAMLHAQVLGKASVDHDQILIGEPIKLTLELHVPLGKPVTWFNLDSIAHFDFVDKGKADTTDNIDGKQILQVCTITSFDSGRWVIPAMPVKVGNRTYFTDSIPVEVGYASYDLSKDYRDIKEIEEVAAPWYMQYIPWILGAVTLIVVAVIVYLLRKPKKAPAPPPPVVPQLSPFDEAMLALEEIRKQGFAQNGEIKSYYIRLNDILRVYIHRKLDMTTLEKTNEELVTELRKVPMDRESFGQLVQALQVADFVKFARYQPEAKDNEQNFAVIKTAITSLNNLS